MSWSHCSPTRRPWRGRTYTPLLAVRFQGRAPDPAYDDRRGEAQDLWTDLPKRETGANHRHRRVWSPASGPPGRHWRALG
jgi:hypothetical protein